ncbi:hypothetical protein [Streptomyces sp. NPDC051561]|uniref:hypothetical protein n=1 Tax=Streptomyces sp. NPDC051561 TaxID=3365658 RepID=UPI0037B65AB7
MPFEDELGPALRRTGDTFTADQRQLVDGGRDRGRRALRRRRMGAVTGSVAALALVGVGGAWAGGLLGGGPGSGGGTGQVAGPAPKGAASSSAPSEVAEPSATGAGQITRDWMINNFRTRLQSVGERGALGEIQARGSTPEELLSGNPMVSGVLDDGRGKAAISLGMWREDPGSSNARNLVTCPARTHVRYDTCRTDELMDGGSFMVLQGYVSSNPAEKAKSWRATMLTPEGYVIDVSESNSPAEKGAPASRVQPPLSPDRLKSLVTHQTWRTAAASLPDNGTTGGEKPDEPSEEKTMGTLVSLLPKGLKVSGKSGQQGYASLVVDDGKGASMVQVNVQTGMGDVADELAGKGDSVTDLPDGGRLVVSETSGEKGVAGIVVLNVDVIAPDGRRVAVSAFNSGSQHEGATRGRPVLSVEQLKVMATSGDWWK